VSTSEAGGAAVERTSEARPSLVGPRIFAGALLLLAAIVLIEAFQIREAGGFQALGPRAFPLAIGVGLLVLGMFLLLRTTLRPDEELAKQAGEEEAAAHWPTVGLALAGLVLYALALDPLGYIVATAAFVPVEARVLGSRHPIRDLIVAAPVAAAIFFFFTEFLGVRLPEGLLDPLL
jgi:putative tricarboxylic transport membrane protein